MMASRIGVTYGDNEGMAMGYLISFLALSQ